MRVKDKVQSVLIVLDGLVHDREIPAGQRRQLWELMRTLIDVREGVAKAEVKLEELLMARVQVLAMMDADSGGETLH